MQVSIDASKVQAAALWDGIKGYYTNTDMAPKEVVHQYKQLRHIERAFRIFKTDLRVRPIFHYRRRRIESHMSIAFAAYAVYKELERQVKMHNLGISVQEAIEEIKTIYQLTITLPDNKQVVTTFAALNQIQKNYYISSQGDPTANSGGLICSCSNLLTLPGVLPSIYLLTVAMTLMP